MAKIIAKSMMIRGSPSPRLSPISGELVESIEDEEEDEEAVIWDMDEDVAVAGIESEDAANVNVKSVVEIAKISERGVAMDVV